MAVSGGTKGEPSGVCWDTRVGALRGVYLTPRFKGIYNNGFHRREEARVPLRDLEGFQMGEALGSLKVCISSTLSPKPMRVR